MLGHLKSEKEEKTPLVGDCQLQNKKQKTKNKKTKNKKHLLLETVNSTSCSVGLCLVLGPLLYLQLSSVSCLKL